MVFGMYSKIVRYYMNTAGLSPVITRCGPKSAKYHFGNKKKENRALDGRVRRVHILETSERYIVIKRSGLV